MRTAALNQRALQLEMMPAECSVDASTLTYNILCSVRHRYLKKKKEELYKIK
jgi:hypothetical protein